MAYYLLSGLLLLLSTPAIGLWPLIFIAFIPILLGLENKFEAGELTFRNAFISGYVTGIFYYGPLFFWLLNVNIWSLLPVVLGFSCTHGLLASGVYLGLKKGFKSAVLCLWLVCIWVSIETLASELFFALPSYAIGYLVWKVPAFIQLADITGVFGISLWIMSVNLLLARWWRDGIRSNKAWSVTTLCMTLVVVGYGPLKSYIEPSNSISSSPRSISLLHTDFQTVEVLDSALKRERVETLTKLTQDAAVSQSEPIKLFIWPESSLRVWFRSISEKEIVRGLTQLARETHSSILVGSLTHIRESSDEPKKFNTAFLVPSSGYIAQEYRKMLLAPGTEMTPLYNQLPEQLRQRWPSPLDAGKDFGVMSLDAKTKFGIFICWEEFYPDFVRQLALEGSNFLVNISNDDPAFGEMRPAFHIPLPHVVFRAVENRKFVVRSSNAGPAMFVSPQGEVLQSSLIGTTGILSGHVTPSYQLTFFTRHGFIFAKSLLFVTVVWLIILLSRPFLFKKGHV